MSNMITNTLGRYFAGRFVVSALGVFASIFVLLVLVDYIEMVRKTSGLASASPIMVAETSLFRVPQLLEKMMPFCVLIGAMTCYLALSRRLELVVARAAGVSAWQFIAPALASAILLGVLATVVYNPMSANLRELSKRMETELFGGAPGGGVQDASGFWINQVNTDGSVDHQRRAQRKAGRAPDRTDAVPIRCKQRLQGTDRSARGNARGRPLVVQGCQAILAQFAAGRSTKTSTCSPPRSRRRRFGTSFSTPETVSFWQLPDYIRSSESSGFATAGYRLQYHKLIAQPFLLGCNGDAGCFGVAAGSSDSAAFKRWF